MPAVASLNLWDLGGGVSSPRGRTGKWEALVVGLTSFENMNVVTARALNSLRIVLIAITSSLQVRYDLT